MNFLSLFLKFAKSHYICYRLTLRIRKKRDAYLTKLLLERSYIMECGARVKKAQYTNSSSSQYRRTEENVGSDICFELRR